MKYRIILITFLLTCSLCPTSHAVTVGQFINPIEDFLDCDSNNSAVQIICNDVQELVNRELAQANLELQDGGLLFTNTDNPRRVVRGGCTTNTELQSVTAKVKLLSSASIDLSGNAISKPAMFMIELPVEADLDASLKNRHGVRVWFGSCSQIGSDRFRAVGNAQGKAKLALFLSLEPKFTVSDDGEFIVQIKPIVDVSAMVDAEVKNVRLRNTSFLFGIYTAVFSTASEVFKFSESILRGESVSRSFETLIDEGGLDLALGLGFTVNNIGVGSDIVSLLATDFANDYAQNEIEGLGLNQVEMDLENNIKRALRLDANGERIFVFDLNFSPKVANTLHRYILKTDKPDYFKTRNCTTRIVFPGRGINREREREFEPREVEECGAYYWKAIAVSAPTTIVPITPPVQYDPPSTPTPSPRPNPGECETYGNTTYRCR